MQAETKIGRYLGLWADYSTLQHFSVGRYDGKLADCTPSSLTFFHFGLLIALKLEGHLRKKNCIFFLLLWRFYCACVCPATLWDTNSMLRDTKKNCPRNRTFSDKMWDDQVIADAFCSACLYSTGFLSLFAVRKLSIPLTLTAGGENEINGRDT